MSEPENARSPGLILPELCHDLMERAPVPMAELEGEEHIIRYANPAFCHLVGKNREALTGRPFVEIAQKGDQCLTVLDRVYRTGESATHTESEQDEPHPVFWSYAMWPVLDATPQPVGVMMQVTETTLFHQQTTAMNQQLLRSSVRQHELTAIAEGLNEQLRSEIDERTRVEEALRSSEQHLELLSNTVPALIFYLDLDRRYRTCNDAFTAWFELRREEIIGRHVREVVGMPAWTIIEPCLDQAYAGRTLEYEMEVPYRSGGTRWVRAAYTPLRGSEGAILGVVVLITDITTSKHAEQSLRESEEKLRSFAGQLEGLIQERTQELIHSQDRLRDLATELNLAEQRERKRLAIELHDHLQQTLVLGKLKVGQARRAAQAIPSATIMQQVDDVLSDALSYTRTLVAELSPPVLRDHGLSAGLRWLAEEMKKHDLEVSVTVPEDGEVKLPEDQVVLLFQSVRELLINSSKYAGTGQASVSLVKEDSRLKIEVNDQGTGFDVAAAAAANSSHLSSKFGLFSIRERMKALGGSFEIISSGGHGTKATLTLPITGLRQAVATPNAFAVNMHRSAHSHETAGAKAPPVKPGSPAIQVLLVDDHGMFRQGLRSMLESYEDVQVVGEAWDGHDAVAAVDRLRPRVVIMDINMPKMNGIEATAEIKARYPDTIVIGLSVHAEGNNQNAMIKAGAAALLTKEAAVEELYGVIIHQVRLLSLPKRPSHQ